MTDRRLIEEWLPIAALGVESTRGLDAHKPPVNRLHVWWARRPLVASRAAVLASLLPADADREKFLHILGIHGDPVTTKRRIDLAKRTGEDLGSDPYGYARAFKYCPRDEDRNWLAEQLSVLGLENPLVLDPTAGGGSIGFEVERLGLNGSSNDLNPVAALILRATVEAPVKYGFDVLIEFKRIAAEFVKRAEPRFKGIFPAEEANTLVLGYLWARTVRCPYCEGLVPLSPNWRLAPDGTGVRLIAEVAKGPGSTGRVCRFEIVGSVKQQSAATVSGGDGLCPWPDCGRVIEGDLIKAEAQAGRMGEQLYAIVFKRRVLLKTKTGRTREKWERGYRAPRAEDDVAALVAERLAEKLPEWEALHTVPNERFPEGTNDDRPLQYGMPLWRDMFSPRQLIGHGISVEVFRELLVEEQATRTVSEATKAAFCYLSLSLDKLRDYNSRMTRWHVNREVSKRGKSPGAQAVAERSLTRSGRSGALVPGTPRR
jgi:putative DNA methylase